MYFSPHEIRFGLSRSNPILIAMLSAVLKPTPSISSARIYGLSFMTEIDSSLYLLYIFSMIPVLTSYFLRNIISSLTADCFFHSLTMDSYFFCPIPRISRSRSGSLFSTFNDSMPNLSTIIFAKTGPIPFTKPLDK